MSDLSPDTDEAKRDTQPDSVIPQSEIDRAFELFYELEKLLESFRERLKSVTEPMDPQERELVESLLHRMGIADPQQEELPEFPDDLLKFSLDPLMFSSQSDPRIRATLEKANIHRLGDLLKVSRDDLLTYRNFGVRSYNALRQTVLSATGIDIANVTPKQKVSILLRMAYLSR